MRLTNEQRELAESNIGLAYHVAIKINTKYKWIEYDEILSICFEALTRSAKGYKPEKAKFSTYAVTAMHRATHREINKQSKMPTMYYFENITDADGDAADWQSIFSDNSQTEDEIINKIMNDLLPELIDKEIKGKAYKAALMLHIKEPDLSQSEVARRIGCRQRTVGLAYNLAKEKLRPLICAI